MNALYRNKRRISTSLNFKLAPGSKRMTYKMSTLLQTSCQKGLARTKRSF